MSNLDKAEIRTETIDGAVYRVGNDFPITLILPHEIEFVDEKEGIGIMRLGTQADIYENGLVEVVYVNSKDYPFPVASHPSAEQVRILANHAFQDLGIVHPGVADLLNFAEDFVA
jgi:hypothetical protein